MRLRDKVALITGGTSGIGRASAILFAREGAAVAFTGRDEARGRAVEDEIRAEGNRARFIRADVTSARTAVERSRRRSRPSAGSTSSSTTPACTWRAT